MAEAQPELLAHHYTEAGLTEQAVHYWHKAGQSAIHAQHMWKLLRTCVQGWNCSDALRDTSTSPTRRGPHIALGASLIATKGFAAPEVGQTYLRARQLCQSLGNPHQIFPVLRGLSNYYLIRAELQTAHVLGEQLLALAQQVQDATMLVAAHRALGATLFWMGAVASAQTHFAQDSPVRPQATPRLGVPLWRGHGRDLPQLCLLDAMAPGLS